MFIIFFIISLYPNIILIFLILNTQQRGGYGMLILWWWGQAFPNWCAKQVNKYILVMT